MKYVDALMWSLGLIISIVLSSLYYIPSLPGFMNLAPLLLAVSFVIKLPLFLIGISSYAFSSILLLGCSDFIFQRRVKWLNAFFAIVTIFWFLVSCRHMLSDDEHLLRLLLLCVANFVLIFILIIISKLVFQKKKRYVYLIICNIYFLWAFLPVMSYGV